MLISKLHIQHKVMVFNLVLYIYHKWERIAGLKFFGVFYGKTFVVLYT